MRRLMMGLLAGLLVVGVLLSGRGSSPVQGFAATAAVTPDAATKQIETALLLPSDQCVTPCFWTLQSGKVTLREFKAFAASAFLAAPAVDAAAILPGVELNGVGLHAVSTPNSTLDTVADYVYLRVSPTEASAAGLNVGNVAPAGIIGAFGNPDDAFLLYGKKKTGSYRLMLLYLSRSMVYTVRGTFQNGKACLALSGLDNLTIYRFADAPTAQKFIGTTATNDGKLPPSISLNTQQKANGFTTLVKSPTACLTPTP